MRENDCGSKILMPGHVRDEDLPALYSGACLFLFTTLYEVFGLPILKARACGTPVVKSDLSARKEVGAETAREKISFFAETLGLLSSVERDREEDVKRRYKNRSLSFDGFQQLEVPATTLNKILTDHEFTSQIDFVSIDVEGSELKVLEGFDLQMYSPRVLVIEANDQASEACLDGYLRSQGYLKARKLEANVFYCKTKRDRRVLSTIPIDCKLEATVHPFGDKYTAERKLTYHAQKSFRDRLRAAMGLPLMSAVT